MDGKPPAGKRKRQRVPTPTPVDEEDDDEDDFMPLDGSSASNPVVIIDSGFSTTTVELTSKPKVTNIGSALKRNADGSVTAPKVLKRKQKGQKVCPFFFIFARDRFTDAICDLDSVPELET